LQDNIPASQLRNIKIHPRVEESTRLSKFPSEQFVKDHVRKYLETQNYQAIISESAIEGGRLDLLAYKWREGGYGIEYLIVECKDDKDLRVKQFVDIVQKQISKYQARYPNVYLAIPTPSDIDDIQDKRFYVTFCKFHRIGLLVVNKKGEIEERVDPEKPAPEEIQAKMEKFDSFATAVLGFLDVFKDQPKKGPYYTWISTSRTPQYSLWYHGGEIRFGVNVEDAKKLKVRVSHELLKKLSSEASEHVEILVRKERYTPGRRREYYVTLKKPFRSVNSDDIQYIVDLVDGSEKGAYNVHINFSILLWGPNQLYGKPEVTQKIVSAREALKNFYESLS
jgi:hypothetical protein